MFQVKLITPQRRYPTLAAWHVTLPTPDGEWGVREGHISFVGLLVPGRLEINLDEGLRRYRIGPGVAHVDEDVVEVFTESATEEA